MQYNDKYMELHLKYTWTTSVLDERIQREKTTAREGSTGVSHRPGVKRETEGDGRLKNSDTFATFKTRVISVNTPSEHQCEEDVLHISLLFHDGRTK